MGAAYLDSLDIANRALQHCGQGGADRIQSVDEDSKANSECSFVYDKLRRAELQRNIWTFATRKAILRPLDTDVLLLDPAAYDETVTYERGAVVKDENGFWWMSVAFENINNAPGSTTAWEAYFGPRTVHPYDSTIEYFAGELVYIETTATPGSFVVFLSMSNGNAAVPDTATDYDATALYARGARVLSGGFMWTSLIEVNRGITPIEGPVEWSAVTSYSIGDAARASDGFEYTSTANGNQGNDPIAGGSWTKGDAVGWTKSPEEPYPAASSWLPLYAGLTSPMFLYPIGTGPSSYRSTANVYLLPHGYLKKAPLNPKAGSISFLGAPGGLDYDETNIENGAIIAMDTGPRMIRFVADVVDVTKFDDMFCEGLAARMAREICESITQSTQKLNSIGQAYQKFMSEARLSNMIEVGPIEFPEDDYITCRR